MSAGKKYSLLHSPVILPFLPVFLWEGFLNASLHCHLQEVNLLWDSKCNWSWLPMAYWQFLSRRNMAFGTHCHFSAPADKAFSLEKVDWLLIRNQEQIWDLLLSLFGMLKINLFILGELYSPNFVWNLKSIINTEWARESQSGSWWPLGTFRQPIPAFTLGFFMHGLLSNPQLPAFRFILL